MGVSYAHPEVLVSTDWVAAHAQDAGVRLVEVDVDTKAYDESHVPGAIAWAWNTQLCDTVVRDIAPKAAFEELLTQSGIGNDTTVVLYGDNNNWFAAWAFWQMKIYGHKDVRIMDGGRKKWLAEARDLFRRATVAEPNSSDAWTNLSLCSERLNDFEQAIAARRKAIEFNPEWAEHWHRLGTCLGKFGDFKEAIITLRKSREMNPADEGVANDLIMALCKDNQLQAAEELAFAAELGQHPAGMLIAVARHYEEGSVREVFRALSPRRTTGPIRIFDLPAPGAGDET